MSAIERCRTAALGGHVARCQDCAYTTIDYNSCRDRHCPKCQGAAAKQWLAEREAELLPLPYFHVVFTLPPAIADIAYQNKAVVYDLLFRAAAETVLTIAADPKHLGARIGITAVLHTWGSTMTHHPLSENCANSIELLETRLKALLRKSARCYSRFRRSFPRTASAWRHSSACCRAAIPMPSNFATRPGTTMTSTVSCTRMTSRSAFPIIMTRRRPGR
jgi:Transposase zinc-binding domain